MAAPNTFSDKTGQIALSLLDENFEYIDTQLSNVNSDQVKIGISAGESNQKYEAIAIGSEAGRFNQDRYSLAIGYQAGQTNQDSYSVAIGYEAGKTNQLGSCIAIGPGAAYLNQGSGSIAIGINAGATYQSSNSIAIGDNAAYEAQGEHSIAIGIFAGDYSQGNYSIAMGYRAGYSNQHNNSIILNASGSTLNSPAASSFTVKPVRNNSSAGNFLKYDSNSGEVTYSNIYLDSAGSVTKPNTPYFHVGKNGVATIAAGNVIVFNVVNHNIQNCYNSSNGRFTAPVDGRYLIVHQNIAGNNGNVNNDVHLRINGSSWSYSREDSGTSNWVTYTHTQIVNLNKNDYVDMYVNTGAVYSNNANWCTFMGYLLG